MTVTRYSDSATIEVYEKPTGLFIAKYNGPINNELDLICTKIADITTMRNWQLVMEILMAYGFK